MSLRLGGQLSRAGRSRDADLGKGRDNPAARPGHQRTRDEVIDPQDDVAAVFDQNPSLSPASPEDQRHWQPTSEQLPTAYQSDQQVGNLRLRLEQLEDELRILRTAKHNADLEIIELQMLLRSTQGKLQSVRDTLTYRVGKIFVDGFGSWRGFVRFVPNIYRFLANHIAASFKPQSTQTRDNAASLRGTSDQVRAISEALAQMKAHGPKQAAEWARSANFEPALLARVLLEIARLVRKSDVNMAIALAKEGVALAPSEQRIKWLAFALADAGAIKEPAELLRGVIEAGVPLNGTETRKADELFALARLASRPLLTATHGRTLSARPEWRRALVVSSRSLPHHWTAATMRIHALALAAKEAGWQADIVTLPGYPGKEWGEHQIKYGATKVAGITYHRLPPAAASQHMIDLYISEASEAVARLAVETRSCVIHLPSEFVGAYVGALAARAAGIPCVYDYSERVPELPRHTSEIQGSERFTLFDACEKTFARNAHAVIARTSGLRDALLATGIDSDRVRLIHDCVPLLTSQKQKPAAVTPPPALANRFVLGFIGEASEQVDLDMLPEVLARVVRAGVDASLLVVGVGRRFEALQARAKHLGVSDRMAVLGRPRLENIHAWYSLIDLVLLPYRAEVQRAPFELMEAVAHGACTVTSSDLGLPDVLSDVCVLAPREKFSDAVIELHGNGERRKSLANGAAAKGKALFAPDRIGPEVCQAYAEALTRIGDRGSSSRREWFSRIEAVR